MRPRLLDRMLVMEVIGYLTFGVALFTTILVAMIELQPLTSAVVQNGVPLWTAVKIFGLSLPGFMAMAFPMSMLLSTLLAFGRLSGDSETTALVAAGVSYYRMAVPITIIGVVVSLMALTFNEVIAPVATQAKNHLYNVALSASAPTKHAFHFQQVVDGHVVFTLDADNYDSETKKLIRPKVITYSTSGAPIGIAWAAWGRWRGGMTWDLHQGYTEILTKDAPGLPVQFSVLQTSVGVSLDQFLMASTDPGALTYRQLQRRIRREEKENPDSFDVRSDLTALYAKLSIPFASVVFALIGFPLGVRRQRSGGAFGFALSIGIIFVYYLIYQYTTVVASNGGMAPILGAWIPDVLGLVAGMILLRRVAS